MNLHDWHNKGHELLAAYLKKVKAPAGFVAVLSPYGDVLVQAGRSKKIDWTSTGSIVSAISSASSSLCKLVSVPNSPLRFGNEKKGLWIDTPGKDLLVLGVNIPFKPEHLKSFYKHLKTVSKVSAKNAAEALDGMNEASLEESLGRGMK